ncbi:MAG: TraX family protein, partial [Acidobacteriota bacterium]
SRPRQTPADRGGAASPVASGAGPSVETCGGDHSRSGAGAFLSRLDGAPLDFLKLVGAAAMVVDHVNTVLLKYAVFDLWYVGRLAFPLFCFGLVCNLHRGTDAVVYVRTLLLFGIAAQPIYGATLGDDGNILFTLAIGAALAAALRGRPALLQHAVFAMGIAAILTPWLKARSGVDFGIAGVLFPAALLLLLEGGRLHAIWVSCLLLTLNAHPPAGLFGTQTLVALLCAGPGSLAVLTLALALEGRARFLPRYALHVFYPGHLLILIALRAVLPLP